MGQHVRAKLNVTIRYRDYITGKEVLQMDVENKMVIDDCWPDYEDDEDQESEWEKFCRMADEEYDESFFAWSRREDGYHF